MGMEGDYRWDERNNMEMFNKSRAQEASMALENMRNTYKDLGIKIKNAEAELKARCPHPDEFVKKLDIVKNPNPLLHKPKALYLCKLCGTTKRKGI